MKAISKLRCNANFRVNMCYFSYPLVMKLEIW